MSAILIDGGMGRGLLRRSGARPTPLRCAAVMMERPEPVEELQGSAGVGLDVGLTFAAIAGVAGADVVPSKREPAR